VFALVGANSCFDSCAGFTHSYRLQRIKIEDGFSRLNIARSSKPGSPGFATEGHSLRGTDSGAFAEWTHVHAAGRKRAGLSREAP